MSQPVRRTFHQVIALAPGGRGAGLLELDVRFEVGDTQGAQPAENVLAGLVAELSPILIFMLAHVAHGYDGSQGILSLRGHRGVEPR